MGTSCYTTRDVFGLRYLHSLAYSVDIYLIILISLRIPFPGLTNMRPSYHLNGIHTIRDITIRDLQFVTLTIRDITIRDNSY